MFLLIVSMFIFGGCGTTNNNSNVSQSEEKSSSQQVKSLVFGAGGAGGSWYLFGAQLSEVLKKEMPDVAVSVIEGGEVSNLRLTNAGIDLDFGMCSLPMIYDAINNTGVFEKDNINSLAPIINFATDYVHFVVIADSGIDSFKDLADKRILPGPKGKGGEVITQRVLEAYNLSYDKVKSNGGSISFVTWGEAPSLLKDGHADMATFKGAIPIANIMEIEATHKAKNLSLDEDVLEKIISNSKGFFKGVIPAGSYKGQDKDAVTLGHTSVFFANKNIPEDVVYKILDNIIDNADKLNQIEGLNIGKNSIEGIDPALLHPGAKKYYEEKGIL